MTGMYHSYTDNPLVRSYQWPFAGTYQITYMTRGYWFFVMDDFGNAVPVF